jgi:hypothetical protein
VGAQLPNPRPEFSWLSRPESERLSCGDQKPVVAPQPARVVPILTNVNGHDVPLTIEAKCVMESDERYRHCEVAKGAGFPILIGGGARTVTKPCVLVGSGPSAIPLLEEIRARYDRGEEIIALKGAHDWLIKNGIIPTAAMALDPQQSRAKCFRRPHKDVLYLCASQMHPDTWTHLAGHRVLIWHSRIGVEQEKRPGWESAFIVPCCSTTGNSAIALMYILGRRVFELYGFDSSLPPVTSWWERLKVRLRGHLHKLDGARVPREKRIFTVTVGGQAFSTTAELAAQAIEIEPLFAQLEGIQLNAHGRGYYQALVAEGIAKGWDI